MMIDSTMLIGVDCAVDDRKTGVARASLTNTQVVVHEVGVGRSSRTAVDCVAEWVAGAKTCVVAIDSPLGWPVDLSKALVTHHAGESIDTDPHQLFRRETDRFVKRILGKQTLDVGADRIARTARAAVGFLTQIRRLTGRNLPLLWNHRAADLDGVIEVYPAGTLKAHDLLPKSYKGNKEEAVAVRAELIDSLSPLMDLKDVVDHCAADDNCLDAAICTLAAADFLSGHCIEPANLPLAKKESWIWFRNPESVPKE